MKYTLLVFLLLIILACNREEPVSHKHEHINKAENDAFFPEYEHGDVKPDTLYLDVRLDNCGEWGGPLEKFRMYVNSQEQYMLEYKRYRFNCDSISAYYGLKNKPLEYKTTIALTARDKKTISDFLENLIEAKISEQVYSNAGSTYHLHNNDSTLNVAVYSEKEKVMEDFYYFKFMLGFLNTEESKMK